MGQPYDHNLFEHQAGDGVDLPLIKARGAERHGVVWMLAASLASAIIAMAGILLLNYPHLVHQILS